MATMLREHSLVDFPVRLLAELHGLETYLELVDGFNFSIDGHLVAMMVLGLTITVRLDDGTEISVVKSGRYLEIQTLDPRHSEYLTRIFEDAHTFLHGRV